jgi:hypothetical protein
MYYRYHQLLTEIGARPVKTGVAIMSEAKQGDGGVAPDFSMISSFPNGLPSAAQSL